MSEELAHVTIISLGTLIYVKIVRNYRYNKKAMYNLHQKLLAIKYE
jgi:hypothetical protein